MKRDKIKNSIRLSALSSLFLLAACTGKFEEFNTNPYGPTPEDMEGDFVATGVLIKNMIPALVQGQQNNSQMLDQMIGSEYGGQLTCTAQWGNKGNFYTYDPRLEWQGNVFDTMMPQIYTNFFQIKSLTEGQGVVYAWATIIRVAASLKISDCYGPIPYSKITGTDYNVAYDNMEDLYDSMFKDLDKAIEVLETAVLANEDFSQLKEHDMVFSGNFQKWVKFANTLKLRMALRLTNVKPDVAQAKAEEAVNDPVGVMVAADDAAYSFFNDGMNPYYRAYETWNGGELRVSANITSYLTGYSDPRLPKYVQPAALSGGGYIGVRNGIFYSSNDMVTQYQSYSKPNISEQDNLLIMSASEAYFLRAEAALRGWNVKGEAKDLYEEGVRVSMTERKATIGDYLEVTDGPADYVDPVYSVNNTRAVTAVSPKYDTSASMETNLQRIMIQKWLANYPNGWETWVDIRRTGYPKFFPVVNNRSNGVVNTERGMRRLPYSQKEYNTNQANVQAAVGMLGGPDNGGTDLWWAKKN